MQNQQVEFVTALGGHAVGIDRDVLSLADVVRKAQKQYQTEVICTPGLFTAKANCIGWRVLKKNDASLLGFLVLSTASFIDFPIEFGGVKPALFIPFGTEWAQVHQFKVRYINGALEIQKAE